MFRGTTPTLYFKVKNIEDLTTIKELNIIFKSHICHGSHKDDKLVKTIDDVTIDNENKTIILDLTQEETLLFKVPAVLVQIKFMLNDNKVCASSICKIDIEEPLDTTIMEEDAEIVIPGGDEEDPAEPTDSEEETEPSETPEDESEESTETEEEAEGVI